MSIIQKQVKANETMCCQFKHMLQKKRNKKKIYMTAHEGVDMGE